METLTLARLLDWRSIGPGRKRTACPRCQTAIELRLLDDLLEVACPGCGASPFFERARDYEQAHGSRAVRQALLELGFLGEDELLTAEEAAGPADEGNGEGKDDQRDLTGAARALGFFRKSLYLAHEPGTADGLRVSPLGALLSGEQLREAVELERSEGRPTGESIAELALLAEKERLRQDLGDVEPCDLDEAEVPAAVRALVPGSVASSLLAIPLRLDGDTLILAVADPLDFELIDQLKLLVGREISTVAAPEEALFRAVERLYPDAAHEDADDDLDDLALLAGSAEAVTANVGALDGFEPDEEEPLDPSFDEPGLDLPDEAPGARTLEALLIQLVEQRATRFVLEPLDIYYRARVRRGGRLRDAARLPRAVGEAVIERAMISGGLDTERTDEPQSGRIDVSVHGQPVALEVACAPTIAGPTLGLRVRPQRARALTIDGIALVPGDAQLLRGAAPSQPGITLVTTPPGEGKTTLLHALLREADHAREHVVSLEREPSAAVHGVTQLAGARYAELAPALTALGPDRIFLDDLLIPDLFPGEAAAEVRLALDLALSGARVVVAVAASDPLRAVARLAATGVESRLLWGTIDTLVSARLVERICQSCRFDFEADDALAEDLGLAPSAADRAMAIGIGCWECEGRGYRGRSALVEVTSLDLDLRERGATFDRLSFHAAARERGQRPLAEKALHALRSGLTSAPQVEALLAR